MTKGPRDKRMTIDEVVDSLEDGITLGVGGWGSRRKPMALVRAILRSELKDLTLVSWGGEFGRTPMSEKGDGRDHNPYGFSVWMAGGGVKGGQIIGATDEFGMHAIENKAHIHDIHATILALLGIDHEWLTFPHNGRNERLTITSCSVIRDIIA